MDILKTASKVPPLFTDRLILSKMLPSDAGRMYNYAKRPIVTEFLSWHPHKNKRYTREYLKFIQYQYQNAAFFDWAVREKNGKMIGTCGFTKLDPETLCGEIGYVLSPKVWGRGYATEAAARVLEFAFEELGLNRVCARFIFGNSKSERVMQKLGMTSLGVIPDPMHIKGEWRTVVEYAITKEEYKQKKDTAK